MLKEALQYLVGLKPVERFTIGPREYANEELAGIKAPMFDDVDVTTLAGIADLLTAGLEGIDQGAIVAHVVNYNEVQIIAKKSDDWGRRQRAIKCRLLEVEGFRFEQYMDHENFIIGLQANFVETPDKQYLLKIASNITAEALKTSEDNGISQVVGLRAGVALKTEETLRNRVTLAPYRTFREVLQPESEFVFRVKQGNPNQQPQLALFEADGGKWKLTAIDTIARTLRTMLEKVDVIS